MPFVPVVNTALVEIRMTLDSQKVENTLWFRFETAINATILSTLGADLLEWWTTFYAPLTSDNTILREIVCTDMASATGPQVSTPAPISTTGTSSGPQLPNNNTLTVSFRTANRGRAFRGRNYIVGLVRDVVLDNTAIPGYITTVIDAYEQLLPLHTTLSNGQWVIASRFQGVDADGDPIPRAVGVATPVTAVVVVDSTVDSQRRRLPGRGK